MKDTIRLQEGQFSHAIDNYQARKSHKIIAQ